MVFRREAPPRFRSDLRAEIARAPRSLRRMSVRDGTAIVELARAAMVVRHRSLEAFSFADARDAWIVDHGDGLGHDARRRDPARRHAVASFYGGLTLRNGVPIGLPPGRYRRSQRALSFNTFDTFRGGEAAFTFAALAGDAAARVRYHRRSASTRISSATTKRSNPAAWWFYAKLGFRRAMRRRRGWLATSSRGAAQSAPSHRERTTLRRLAERHLVLRSRAGTPAAAAFRWPRWACARGRAVGACGLGPERAVDEASTELLHHCALASLRGFSPASARPGVAWRRSSRCSISANGGR
jgi:hypothetical protein